ncbi:MAG: heavy-metal-associated domain-containing protein [Spirosomataceae bacterium]
MKTLQFKTTINCGGCVAKVTPFLNQLDEVETWKVDTNNPDKILTVNGEELDVESIKTSVKQAGFEIEQV